MSFPRDKIQKIELLLLAWRWDSNISAEKYIQLLDEYKTLIENGGEE